MHIKDMLDRLVEAGLALHPEKMQLSVTEIAFLGHVLAPGIIRPDPNKVKVVVEFPMPRNVKEVQQFVGLTGYWQCIVQSCVFGWIVATDGDGERKR